MGADIFVKNALTVGILQPPQKYFAAMSKDLRQQESYGLHSLPSFSTNHKIQINRH
jgi:hypothetical protein